MSLNLELLKVELTNVLKYWQTHVISDNGIAPEIEINGARNSNADLGSMYLGRVIYGAAAACNTLSTKAYLPIAKQATKILTSKFKNPEGGYYWALNNKGETIHDADNNNMAQAFVLYGLAEYALLTKEDEIIRLLNEHTQFVLETIKDLNNGGFLDGFDQNSNALPDQTKALGTHLHLLEAFEKVFLLNKNDTIKHEIENLIDIITSKFIDTKTLHCLHRLKPNWQPLANEIWAGHDVEVSWILCKAAKTIQNKELIERCNALAVKTTDNTLKLAYDSKKGGLFNVLENGKATENIKVWWPQPEMVLALLNCYEITNNDNYLKYANDFSNYISNNFISESGEWYTELSLNNEPINTPIVFFWKSLYHNVRYYAEIFERLN